MQAQLTLFHEKALGKWGGNCCEILEVLVKIAKVQFYSTNKFNVLVKARSGQWQNSTYILTKALKVICGKEQRMVFLTQKFLFGTV